MKLDTQTTFDIDPALPPTLYYVLCIILSAHTIYIMTTTPPRFPTLYWNYVSYYENGQRTHPSPPTYVNSHSICIGIMYYVMNCSLISCYYIGHRDHFCLEGIATTPPLYWNLVLCYEIGHRDPFISNTISITPSPTTPSPSTMYYVLKY